jgi:hypothetical protein
MRRIIERIVTVVTTTTWKISWEADPPHAQRTADSASTEPPGSEILLESMPPRPTIIETKEVDPPEKENTPD